MKRNYLETDLLAVKMSKCKIYITIKYISKRFRNLLIKTLNLFVFQLQGRKRYYLN